MKKILIVNNNMHIGGVQKALVSLLWSIHDRCDVTLLLFWPQGPCMEELPPDVKIIQAASAYRYLGMPGSDAKGLKDKLGRGFFAAVSRVFGRSFAVRLMALTQKPLKGYDIAVSYLHNGGGRAFYGGCNDFVLRHTDAAKKIAYLHCDYRLCGADTEENGRMYRRFDRIAACSQGCADSFLAANPNLRERVRVVPNCHRFDQIRQLADQAPVSPAADRINLVTVARLGKEKGVERALRVLASLGEERNRLHYYIIGDGIQKPLLLQIIGQEGLQDCVTLCGMQSNPYGYICAADLLLIPSYSEAAPLVIGEAGCLGTPILSMETSSAREMIEATGFGWVCDNSEAAMAAQLKALLAAPETLAEAKKRLARTAADNEAAIAAFLDVTDF